MDAKIGDKIVIIAMRGEPDYTGKLGIVTRIDSLGQIHGTWGGLAIIPELDDFQVEERGNKDDSI